MRRSRLVELLAFGAMLAILLALGTWQVERLGWKRNLIAERRAAIDAPAVELHRPADGRGLPAFRHVRATGTFRHDDEILVGPRSRDGIAGWRVVTPLALEGGGFMLVDRGFVPDERKAPETRAAGQVHGVVAVDGLLRRPGAKGWFTPDNVPAEKIWLRIDPPGMARALHLADMAPYWIAAGPAPNPGGYPAGGDAAVMPRNAHLQYAITWYALAVALIVMYVVFRRQNRGVGGSGDGSRQRSER